MKKTAKILLRIVLVPGLLAGGFGLAMSRQIRQTYQRLDAVPVTGLSQVRDGVFEGAEETALVKAAVLVTVKDRQIQEIRLTRHENGKGAPAEAMLPEMVRRNTSEVDTVSGATMSAKTIRAAVRNALAQGASGVQEGGQ